ncbi:serine/threonine protein kinase [Treponema sp. OMZ 788]|uniref:serine/threonine protein kinase n=1 Tax=Treponema sp. OMZ 788 TaxID=2563664 RepID=UPI0020A3AF18|nr:serine/threonine-protein kinase [Treponema sp. OMZ 788]UTC64525.1 serine/threonine protein kinase [Treponema sp. OMZ 788]
MTRLKKNQIVKTIDGKEIRVIDALGEGGQGIVYKVHFNNKNYALKWYKKSTTDDFYENLKKNAKKGVPADTFLWPLAITERNPKGCFGYVMELCPSNYKSLSQFLLNNVRFKNMKAIVNAGTQITASFKLLHNQGYSYQDLNDGNFFIDPNTGNIRICDNDNIAPNGINLGILGKPRYMAPEVVSSEHLPDTYSDRFSLAIILFLLFFRGHPLEGKRDNCDKPNNEYNLFCDKSLFVFDPKDDSNRPKPQIHKNVLMLWNVFPGFVQKEFIKAFDKNLMRNTGVGRGDRIIEKEWLQMFRKLRQSIVTCPKCKEQTFFNMKKEMYKCMNCGVNIERPMSLVIGKAIIPLQPTQKIYNYEIDDAEEMTIENLNQVVGEVIENPKKPGIWGLKNISKTTWYRKTPGGKEFSYTHNSVITIVRNNTIKFGTKGEGFIS